METHRQVGEPPFPFLLTTLDEPGDARTKRMSRLLKMHAEAPLIRTAEHQQPSPPLCTNDDEKLRRPTLHHLHQISTNTIKTTSESNTSTHTMSLR